MYSYTRISPETLSDVYSLMNSSNSLNLSISELREKFSTEMMGAAYIGFLAHDKMTGEPAAFYGVFPLRVRLAGQDILAAQSGDTVTHPKHRGKGLFVFLAKMTYELAEKNGIKFIFGYPNSNSYPGFINKLNWQHPYNMLVWNRLAPTFPLQFISKRFPLIKKAQARFASYLSKKFFDVSSPSNFVEKYNIPDTSSHVIHDEKFAKYKQHRGIVISCGSARFWIKFDDDICFGLIASDSNSDDIAKGLRRLYMLAIFSGFPRLKSYFSPNSKMASQLSTVGFTRDSLAYGFCLLDLSVNPALLETTYVDYDTF